MAAPEAVARPITILNLGEGDHAFEVPKVGPDGKPVRGPGRTEDRGDGRTRTAPGKIEMEYYHLRPRAEPEAGGQPSRLSLSEGEFSRLAKDANMGPLLRDLVSGASPEVMIIGATLPAA